MTDEPRVSISIHRARDGRIRHRVRGWVEGRRVDIALCDTREEAEEHAQAFREQRRDLESGMTLAAWGERWLARRAADGAHRSAHKDESRWRHHVASSSLGGRLVTRITRVHVHRWVQELAEKRATHVCGKDRVEADRPISRQTVVHALNLVKVALAAAADDGLVPSNVALDVRAPPRPPLTDEPWTYLSAREIERLFALTLRPDQRAIFTVAIYAGLRAGELWGLRWCDVRLSGDRPELHVCRSYRGPTKSGRPRIVPLLTPAREALSAWRKLAAAIGEARVFPAEGGGCHAEGFDAGFPRVRRLLKIKRRVRFHDLRHTCCSHLMMGTWGRAWRVEEVRDFAGHSSITVTQRYAHLSPDHLHGARAATDDALRRGHQVGIEEPRDIRSARPQRGDKTRK